MLAEIAERVFAENANSYPFRKAEAEASVRCWKWYTFTWSDPRPLWFERSKIRRGRRIRAAPESPEHRSEGGFDAAGRLLVERDYTEFGPYEAFYRYSDSEIARALFHYGDHHLINLTVVRLVDGRAVESDAFAEAGWSRERYSYQGELLASVEMWHAERRGSLYEAPRLRYTAIPTFAQKKLVRLELVWSPDPPWTPHVVTEVVLNRTDA